MGIEPKLEIGERGQFDVIVNGEVVASRSRNYFVRALGVGWPKTRTIVEEVAKRLRPIGS